MDFARPAPNMMREDFDDSVRKRLETFQFRRGNVSTVGMTLPSQSLPGSQRGSHVRNGSTSSSLAFSTSTNSIISTLSDSSSASDSRPMSTSGPKSRPTSHHRRRSSVSTRVESAEMMGVDVVSLPPSSSDDNVNFGDKDSIRRRALLALEGNRGFDAKVGMVEIPEFNSSKSQGSMDAFAKHAPSTSSFVTPSLSGKRDSFGKLLSTASSSKDQLHTLLEVEEEEEDEKVDSDFSIAWTPQKFSDFPSSSEGSISERSEEAASFVKDNDFDESSFSSDSPELMVTSSSPLPVRHRPTSLALRPLTLASNTSHPTLPTPSLTPSPRPLALRKLSLTPSSDSENNSFFHNDDSFGNVKHASRDSLVRSPSPQSNFFSSRTSANGSSTPSSTGSRGHAGNPFARRGRSSSQAAIFTAAGLPTPDGTPTFERRPSASSTASDESIGKDRRTASEEIFMQQSHASLLARIAELELALSHQNRSRSRPTSIMSVSSTASSEPPDELLQLVADLKLERDELNRDVDGWRQRVRDLEHSKGVMERRLDAERRENWLKGEKLGLVEVEKENLSRQLKMKESIVVNLTKKLENVDTQLRNALRERDAMHEDAETAKRQLADAHSILNAKRSTERDLAACRAALAEEEARNEELLRELERFKSFSTGNPSPYPFSGSHSTAPNRQGLGFQSVDSTSTTVDPEEHQLATKGPFTLKAVEEEECDSQEEDNGLAHYEDEEDSDTSFSGLDRSSSYDSFDEDDLPRSVTHLQFSADHTPLEMTPQVQPRSVSASPSPSPSPSPCPTPTGPVHQISTPTHVNRASLSKTWTFPRGERSPSPSQKKQDEVDRFFICLEDMDELQSAVAESNKFGDKSIFSEGLKLADNDACPPFVLPVQPSISSGMLESVTEEDESSDDFDCEEVEGGVKFVFSPPLTSKSPSSSFEQFMDDQDSDETIPFMFPQRTDDTFPSSSSSKASSVLPSSPVPSVTVSPSPVASIPATPKMKSFTPASRIPPPSPPKFSAPKTRVQPPLRKAVPTFSPRLGSTSTSASSGTQQVSSSPKVNSRLPVYTNTKSSNESQSISYRSESDKTSLKTTIMREDHFDCSSTAPSTTASRFGFNRFNSLLSSSFSWTSSPSTPLSTSSACTPRYVSRDKQLSLLKQRVEKAGHRLHMLPQQSLVGCRNCDSERVIVM
ncbi:hypothetical protein SCHPADRAFT_926618 [Schizopora paradoxa]|uniref:Uncharacterized protein n=1 Tax=Schizopora paradoxa TaxID=27342 RepID=A0A0H2RXP5_9AGAM|nr:hypothetical protein SCHPADRAFT_926618 [Schizopora paradoxa]